MSQALFISRQPVLDRAGSLHDYIFYYAPYEQTQQNNHSKAFIEALFQIGLKNLSDGRQAFIKVNREMLMDPSVFTFLNELLILGIDDAQHIDEVMLERIKTLRGLNFKFAIFHTTDKEDLLQELVPLLPLSEYLIVDASATDPEILRPALDGFLDYPLKMIAANITDDRLKETYRGLGFGLFSGHYFLDIEIDDEKEIDRGYQETLSLLNTLHNSDSIDIIAEEFATYPHITLRLLRYLNSPAFMMRQTIKSIRHGLLLIGRKELRRWLLLLAFSQSDEDTPLENPLLYSANARMALMRFVVSRLKDSERSLKDEAPFVAILSLLSPLIGISYEKLFESIDIDEKIKHAILSYEGKLGSLLELCIATEQLDHERVSTLLEELGLDPDELEKALLESYEQESGA